MAIFYVDPIGGSDAGAGNSFATRWQSLTSGATAARIAAGDTIRVIASPDPTSLGQTATFNTKGCTLTTAVTSDITQATTAWTASTNVTTTTNTARKLGATSSSIAVNATFTTGKAAYLNLGTTLDLSAYQQVSFWINMTAGTMAADGNISLRLCSDTTGDVTVNTISVPRIKTTAFWQAYTVDLGTALGSSIQSIALYIDVDNAAQTFLLNNIFAAKASSAADSLSLTSLIGTGNAGDPWLPIQSITGTTVVYDHFRNSNQPTGTALQDIAPAYGAVTAFKREPINLPSAFVNTSTTGCLWGTINDSGTAGSPITFSGGWNRTDMSTQTGDTYISNVNGQGGVISIAALAYVTVDKINLCNGNYNLLMTSANAAFINITMKDSTNASSYTAYTYGSDSSFSIDNLTCSQTALYITTTPMYNVNINIGNMFGAYTQGFTISGSSNAAQYINCTINNMRYLARSASPSTPFFIASASDSIFNFNSMSDVYASTMLNIASSSTSITNVVININGTFSALNSGGSIITNTGSNNLRIYFNNGALPVKTGAQLYSGVGNATNAFIYNATNNGAGSVTGGSVTLVNSPYSASMSVGRGGKVIYANVAGVTTDQRIYLYGTVGTILTDSTIRHSLTGISWKMTCINAATVASAATATFPITLPVAKVACNANALVTAKVWVYRTSTSLTTNFVCKGSQIAGVATDVSTTASAAINTWEELTITFTPTQQGVVELQVDCYGVAASVYVDDFSVSQA